MANAVVSRVFVGDTEGLPGGAEFIVPVGVEVAGTIVFRAIIPAVLVVDDGEMVVVKDALIGCVAVVLLVLEEETIEVTVAGRVVVQIADKIRTCDLENQKSIDI